MIVILCFKAALSNSCSFVPFEPLQTKTVKNSNLGICKSFKIISNIIFVIVKAMLAEICSLSTSFTANFNIEILQSQMSLSDICPRSFINYFLNNTLLCLDQYILGLIDTFKCTSVKQLNTTYPFPSSLPNLPIK